MDRANRLHHHMRFWRAFKALIRALWVSEKTVQPPFAAFDGDSEQIGRRCSSHCSAWNAADVVRRAADCDRSPIILAFATMFQTANYGAGSVSIDRYSLPLNAAAVRLSLGKSCDSARAIRDQGLVRSGTRTSCYRDQRNESCLYSQWFVALLTKSCPLDGFRRARRSRRRPRWLHLAQAALRTVRWQLPDRASSSMVRPQATRSRRSWMPVRRARIGERLRVLFGIDPAHEPERARLVHDSHLSRARWMTEVGYRQLLQVPLF
jgi:hypothetical protein